MFQYDAFILSDHHTELAFDYRHEEDLVLSQGH